MTESSRARSRWLSLAVIAMTQLMVVLDGTIVNIALPRAQAELGLTDLQRQWVVTAYALVFGALLLLGGRVADYWGRKRSFLVGMAGFAAASAFGGFAQSGVELIFARGLQGMFAALLAPAALALLTVTFPSGRERQVAFAVFGAVAGSGAAVGLLLGGALTQFVSWRWCLLVNVIFAIIGVIGGLTLVRESRAEGSHRYDLWGALVISVGLGALVYGFTLAENSWTDWGTIGFLAAGLALIGLFVGIEARVENPLLPLRIERDATRAGAFLIQAIVGTVLIGSTLFITLYLQGVMLLSPLQAGLATVAMSGTTLASTPLLARLIVRVGARRFLMIGPLVVASGLTLLWARITPDADYWTQVMPSLLMIGIGMGFIFVPLQNVALTGVAPHDAGAASALVNSSMQIGGSIGLSVYSVIAARTLAAADAATPAAASLAHAYATVFLAAGGFMVVAFLVSALMIRPAGASRG